MKERKNRIKGHDMTFGYCEALLGWHNMMSTPYTRKIQKRKNLGQCIACGKIQCQCKSKMKQSTVLTQRQVAKQIADQKATQTLFTKPVTVKEILKKWEYVSTQNSSKTYYSKKRKAIAVVTTNKVEVYFNLKNKFGKTPSEKFRSKLTIKS